MSVEALFRERNEAQDTVEYGILIATIAIIVLIGIARFGDLVVPWLMALASRITTTGT
jgi:Flp pilus assembly pilin Flp